MKIEGDEVETLDTTTEAPEETADEVVEQNEGADEGAEEEEPEALVVQFGEEEPEEVEEVPHQQALRNMRDRIKELEGKLKERAPAEVEAKPALGPRPKRDDFDYDEAAYDAATDKWHEDKRTYDAEQAEVVEQQRKAAEEWNGRLAHYNTRKTELAKRVPDMDEAEEFVLKTFDQTQQGILVQAAEDAAVLAYALAKNPKKAKELAGERNHILFTKKLALMEASLKTSTRKAPPPTDKPLKGTSSTRGAVDGELDRLRADAEKTGDFSKVMAYKRQRAA